MSLEIDPQNGLPSTLGVYELMPDGKLPYARVLGYMSLSDPSLREKALPDVLQGLAEAIRPPQRIQPPLTADMEQAINLYNTYLGAGKDITPYMQDLDILFHAIFQHGLVGS